MKKIFYNRYNPNSDSSNHYFEFSLLKRKMNLQRGYLILVLLMLSFNIVFGQFFTDDFDDNTGTVTMNFSEQCNDGLDFFDIVCLNGGGCGNEVNAAYSVSGGDGGSFFAAQDIDAAPCNAGAVETLTFDNINIMGQTDIHICFEVAEDDDGANEDWDASDFVNLSVDINNSGTFLNIVAIRNDGSTFNGEPGFDTDCSGTRDGASITSSFTTYCVAIAGTGMTMDLRITAGLDSGDEDIAIDNIRLYSGSGSLPASVTSFTCPGNPIILPVNLNYFTAKMTNLKSVLNWQTSSEENNDYFSVEHSTDGRNFKEISQVVGAGTTIDRQDYQYLHENPSKGMNYYRLKQVDYDGAFSYSDMEAVEIKGIRKIKIYPTIATNAITIESGDAIAESTIEIFDFMGRLVKSEMLNTELIRHELNIADLEKGSYILRVHSEGELNTKRFIKL